METDKKINLIHVVDRLDVGGMENGVINICNWLNRNYFNPMICCLNDAGVMANRLNTDVKLFNLRFAGKISPLNIIRIVALFRKQEADIVHTHAWGGGSLEGILAAKIARVPIIINGEHGTFFEKWYQLIIQRILFMMCNANLAVSSSLRDKLVEKHKVPTDKITVIKNGVDVEKFSGRYSRNDVIAKLNNEGFAVKDDLFTIISVASLKPSKNQKLLLDALKIVVHDYQVNHVQILFVGDGRDRKILAGIAKKYSLATRVFFLGNRTDIPELLSLSDLLVSTSIACSEGLSNVLLEAMSSGLPVIATDSIGSKEIVRDGYNGYLIKDGDAHKLAYYIKQLAAQDDELARLGKNAREAIIKDFSISTMIQNYQNLYFEALRIK